MITRIPFSILSNNMITVPVTLNDEQHKFIFDTGIGITLISKRTADSLKLKADGVFYGKRMSGRKFPSPYQLFLRWRLVLLKRRR